VTRTATRAHTGLEERLRALQDASAIADGRLAADDTEFARADRKSVV
jgi:hypothetical protein